MAAELAKIARLPRGNIVRVGSSITEAIYHAHNRSGLNRHGTFFVSIAVITRIHLSSPVFLSVFPLAAKRPVDRIGQKIVPAGGGAVHPGAVPGAPALAGGIKGGRVVDVLPEAPL